MRAHIFPRLLKACSRELKSIGVRNRRRMSLQLRFEGRQSLSMSHREREFVPDGRTNERKGTLFYVCSEYGRCECQQRGGECVMGCTVKGGQTDKEEQCQWSRCSSLVFYSALYTQPMQIHKVAGGGGWHVPGFGALQTRRAAQFITRWTLLTSFWGIPAKRKLQ